MNYGTVSRSFAAGPGYAHNRCGQASVSLPGAPKWRLTPAVEENAFSSVPAPSNTFPERFVAFVLVRPAIVWFSSAVLLFTALAKLFSVAHPVPVLLLSAPVFSFASRLTIFRIAACVELLPISAILLTSSYVIRLTLIDWLSSLFLVYHLGLLGSSIFVAPFPRPFVRHHKSLGRRPVSGRRWHPFRGRTARVPDESCWWLPK